MKKLMKGVVALVLLASLVACSTSDVAEENTSTDSNTTDNEALNIGFIGPLEGDTSVYGIAVKNGGELALNDYNEANGTNFVFVPLDSRGDSTEAVSAYNKLTSENNVVGILGGVLSGESTAVASQSLADGTPIISASATVSQFTLTGDNVFRGCFTDPFQAESIAEFAVDTLGATTAAIIYDSGSDYSSGMNDKFKEVFEAKGGSVVDVEAYSTGDVDFNTQLTKIKAANPDVIFVPNYYKDDAQIAKQAKDLGIESALLGGDGWDGILGVADDPSDVENAIYVNHYAPDDEEVVSWLEKYKEVYGIDANAFSVLAYDSMNILLDAITNADSTAPDDVVAALAATDYSGILGHLTFDDNGDPIKDVAFIQINDGVQKSYGK